MGDPVSAQSRALAEARASEVKGWLIRMGVAASAIYDGTTPLGEMVTRKAAASSLTRDEIDSNTVVVELVCDPAK